MIDPTTALMVTQAAELAALRAEVERLRSVAAAEMKLREGNRLEKAAERQRPTGVETVQTKTKIGRDGQDLPDDATDHVAVRIEHPLLAQPLIVTAQAAPKTMTWKQAAKWAESLDLCGWSWRLPTVEEAFMIPDRSKYPAVDAGFFTDFDPKRYEWIWTGTPDADDPAGCAWYVSLSYGFSLRYSRSDRYLVRAVRAGQ